MTRRTALPHRGWGAGSLFLLLCFTACDPGQVFILSDTSEEVRVDTLYGACSGGEAAFIAEVLVEGYDTDDMDLDRTVAATVPPRTDEADRGVDVQLFIWEDRAPDGRQHRVRLTSLAERMGLEPGRSYVLDVAQVGPGDAVTFRPITVDIPRCD